MGRRGRRGHYCWCCGAARSNEAFSGHGHSRHVCKECSKLGSEELAYRQEVRNIERLLDWDGRVRRKTRKPFERYLSHANPRIRAYAVEVAARDARERENRAKQREALELEEGLWEDEDPPEVFIGNAQVATRLADATRS
jgi:hypothetical protein